MVEVILNISSLFEWLMGIAMYSTYSGLSFALFGVVFGVVAYFMYTHKIKEWFIVSCISALLLMAGILFATIYTGILHLVIV